MGRSSLTADTEVCDSLQPRSCDVNMKGPSTSKHVERNTERILDLIRVLITSADIQYFRGSFASKENALTITWLPTCLSYGSRSFITSLIASFASQYFQKKLE